MNSRSNSPSTPHPFCFFFSPGGLFTHAVLNLALINISVDSMVHWLDATEVAQAVQLLQMIWQHMLLQEGLLSRPAQSQEHGDRKFLQGSWTAPSKVLKPSAGSELAFDMDHVSRFNLSAPDRCERVWRCRGECTQHQEKYPRLFFP